MTKLASAPANSLANEGMKMSLEARVRMRRREKAVFNYYDDMGPGKGSCAWGAGWRRPRRASFARCAGRSCRRISSMHWSA
jgi:hypothetical protein